MEEREVQQSEDRPERTQRDNELPCAARVGDLGAQCRDPLLDARDPDVAVKTSVTGVIRLKDSPLYNRLWLEVLDLKDGIKIGEQFDGTLLVGKSTDTMLVPRKHIIESGGRRFLVTEIKTGLETEDETEITGHSSLYLEPEYPEAKNGKDKTVR